MNTKTRWLWQLQLVWLALALAAVIGFRVSVLSWRTALLAEAAAAGGLIFVGFCSLLVLFALLRAGRPGSKPCLVAVALSLPALIAVLLLGMQGAKAPPIHDITTDPDNPPVFTAAQKLRRTGDNPIEYAGATVVERQRQTYVDIVPLMVPLPPAQAFAKSVSVAEQLRWQVVARSPEQGVIEAVDRTLIFGFTDDIVIRISGTEGGSRIDLRSASRAGVSDLGVNAKRIRSFIHTFNSSQAK